MRHLLDRFFNRTAGEIPTWTEEVNVEVPSTPVSHYVGFMLLQMPGAAPQTRLLNRSEHLPTLTFGAHTAEPPPLDVVVKHLKEMCNIEAGPHSTPVEGSVHCTIQGTPFDVRCRFDDEAEACCSVRIERLEQTEDSPTPDGLPQDHSGMGEPRVIRPGSPEYELFVGKKVRIPWRERIRQAIIYALICFGVVLGWQIAACLMVGEMQWTVLKMIGMALSMGVFIFVLVLIGYAQR